MNETNFFSNKLFRNIESSLVEEFLSISKQIEYQKDDLIIEENNLVDGMYYITKGVVSVIKNGEKNDVFITNLGNNSFFGEISFITNQTASANVIAQANAVCRLFEGTQVFDFLDKHPQFAKPFLINIIAELCTRLKNTTDSLTFHLSKLSKIMPQNEIDKLLSHLK